MFYYCHAGVSKGVLAAAATVPLAVLLLVVTAIIIVAGVYWARLRRKQHDHFRPIVMGQVDNEDC